MMTGSSMSIEKTLADLGLDGVRFDTVEEVNRSFTTLPSFGSMLPYRSFDEQHKVFILGDSAKKERYVGAMWEYMPFVHEANSLDGQQLAIANMVETALLQIPEGYAFQFITVSDRNVGPFLPLPSDTFLGSRREGPKGAGPAAI